MFKFTASKTLYPADFMKRSQNITTRHTSNAIDELPDWMTGWQRGGNFINPNSHESIGLPDNIQDISAPLGIPTQSLIGNIEPSLQTQNSYALLAVLAALTAPFLYRLNEPGICLHFHGNSEEARQALLYSASSVWQSDVYDFKDVRNHMVGLKIFHKDTALCLSEVPANRTKDMHRFLRRYFLGRKGAEPGVSGVVISTGGEPLAHAVDREIGFNAFVEKERVFAIDISLGGWPNNYAFKADDTIAPKLIDALKWDTQGALRYIRTEQSRLVHYLPKPKGAPACERVSSFFWFLNAVGNYIGDKEGLNWWTGGALPRFFHLFINEVDGQNNLFMTFLKHIATKLPRSLKLGGHEFKLPSPYISLKRGRVLIPAGEMRQLIESKSLRLRFTAWLRKNKVLIPQYKTKLLGTYHSPKHKKSIRAYKLDIPHLLRLLESNIK